jgi:hypothetical protein
MSIKRYQDCVLAIRSQAVLTLFPNFQICKNGDACKFLHPDTQGTDTHIGPAVLRTSWRVQSDPRPLQYHDVEQPGRLPFGAPTDTRSTVPCRFLARPGGCQNPSCPFSHEVEHGGNSGVRPPATPSSTPTRPDTRGTVPCKFATFPAGCQNPTCAFLHTTNGYETRAITNKEVLDENEVRYFFPMDPNEVLIGYRTTIWTAVIPESFAAL